MDHAPATFSSLGHSYALGWFLRVVPAQSAATSFYEGRFRLPLVRRIGTNQLDVYWAGEVTMFELVFSPHVAAKPRTHPATQACIPVFRVAALEALRVELAAAGIETTGPIPRGRGLEATILDSDGFPIALRERPPSSTTPADTEARRRMNRGEAYNPGCAALRPGLQELGWVVRTASDPAALLAFYRDVVGLRELPPEDGRPQLDLGDNAILELAPGGFTQPAPADRHHADAFFVIRVGDIAGFRGRMRDHGVAVVNERLVYHWAEIAYFADPEGHVFGVEQGFHPGTYAPEKPVWPEALEAERRSAERTWREHDGVIA